jgi:isoleucyl-tRNA synthetase
MKLYPEYKKLDLPGISEEIGNKWQEEGTFAASVSARRNGRPWVFYEGPPSANGLPGIHHVMSRSIKDIFCRFKTLQGYLVERKAGWDTHGLPIELAVEKSLGITKEDIGNRNSPRYISVEDYNKACRKEVMKYKDKWEEVTAQMGYWVDMAHPYITYDNKYIESVWWLLANMHRKGLLYKGYSIQPYSPAAGSGLSSHELNQPGCYRNVKDRTAVAMFRLQQEQSTGKDTFFLAWTTTPWTLPSNTALAVGPAISYAFVDTFNPFTGKPVTVVLAEDLIGKYFPEKNRGLEFGAYQPGDKNVPFRVIKTVMGSMLVGLRYEQLLPFVKPEGDAFRVLAGDFVTTTEGTGIVHIAPSFGADDFRVAAQNNIAGLTLVDRRGRFTPEVSDGVFLYGEEFVKEDYLKPEEKQAEFAKQKSILESKGKIRDLKQYLSVDERIVLKLQEEGKLFKKEIYEHSYPHCWRTDKPVLYYPLDSWFIKSTAAREKMIALNNTINWKPESTGTGRFGNWLENLNDWNLSRSRFWGIPIPLEQRGRQRANRDRQRRRAEARDRERSEPRCDEFQSPRGIQTRRFQRRQLRHFRSAQTIR